jgi:hypothetical protein
MRQNDGKLYKDIREQHEKSCENDGKIHSLSVNTACLWGCLDMAEQDFPVYFNDIGEPEINQKEAYKWFLKWFGTWAYKEWEKENPIREPCKFLLEDNDAFERECTKGIDLAEFHSCHRCNQYSPV